jgi:hypothetical protein
LKRKLLFVSVLLLMVSCHSASAQFWKRKDPRARKGKYYNKYPIKPATTAKPKVKPEKPKKKRELEYPQTVKKDRYRIDIMIPLYVDELVRNNKLTYKGNVPEKYSGAVSFYEGVKMAADTLAHLGYQADIYVHDITQPASTVEKLLAADSLDKSDLLIGFVPNQQVAPLAAYAKKQHINFISAFSPFDAGIKDNPYFILLNPTLQSHCDFLVSYMAKKHPKDEVIIYHRNKVVLDSSAYVYLTRNHELKHTKDLVCDKQPDSVTLSRLIGEEETVVILMAVMDNQYAETLVKQLHELYPDRNFEIFGMPSWKGITTTKKMTDLGPRITVSITQPYFFDPSVSSGQMLASLYKKHFGGKPSETAYRGFETVYWFTDLLTKYGTIFNEKTNDDGMAIFTRFDIKPVWDDENNFFYNENRHLYIYRYQGGTVLTEQ